MKAELRNLRLPLATERVKASLGYMKPCLRKKKKKERKKDQQTKSLLPVQSQCSISDVPATYKEKAGGFLEPRGPRPAWAIIEQDPVSVRSSHFLLDALD